MSSFALNMGSEIPIRSRRSRRVEIIVVIALVIVFAVLGFLVGYFVMKSGNEVAKCEQNGIGNGQPTNPPSKEKYHEMFQEEISAEEIEKKLRNFTSQPHIAGNDRQKELAKYLARKWRGYGFDKVELPEYKVLLSMPQESQPNKVEVIDNGTVTHRILCKIKVSAEPNAGETFDHFPYFAYSPNGTVSGPLVYINRGYAQDLEELRKRNISINGSIVIARGRFSVVSLAAFMGAVGALVFTDVTSNETYPNTPQVSGDAIFERPVYKSKGDPLTPGIPSIDGMHRNPRNDKLFGSIPTQPISNKDALTLLSRLQGEVVPSVWQGGINFTVRFGPGFKNPNETVQLQVNNQRVPKFIYNVIGTIQGKEEPDRYVLIGNHRDAWLFGAADPSSGTAVLTEISRVVGRMLKQGWRPRRTVKFCSWGGEEFGLIGSVEWVEQNLKILQARGVVYLNTDVAVGGNYVLVPQNGPLLTKAIFSWAKRVRDPNAHGDKTSLYDIMVERNPSKIFPGEPDTVPYKFLSDYLPFIMYSGVPSADFSYFFGPNNELYPVYHTQEDNFYWMKKFIDPKFEFHQAVTKFQGGLLIDLADTMLLPFDVTRYAEMLFQSYQAAVPDMEKRNISTEIVHKAILKFRNATDLFVRARSNIDPSTASPLVLRRLNDQMVEVEKAFISSLVVYGDFLIRHAFAHNSFAGVKYAMRLGQLNEVSRQWSVVAETISSAADILNPL